MDSALIADDSPVLAQIDSAATRYGVDRNLAHVVAQMESGYDPSSVSPKGAQGVMQLMPATASSLGVKDPSDSAQNIDAGVRYLSQLQKKYAGDPTLVLAAYNAGPGAVDKYGGVPPYKETKNYVNRGLTLLNSATPTAPAATGKQPSPQDLGLIPDTPTLQSLGMRESQITLPGEQPNMPPPQKSFGGFMENVGTSLYNNLISPVVHPAQTLAGISNLLEGMSQKTGNPPVPGMQGRQALDALGNLYTQRYGSVQGFKDAFYNDPIGILNDLVTVASVGGFGVSAAQDFLKATGLSEAAMEAQNALAKGVSNVAKGPSAVAAFGQGVTQAVPGAVRSAVDRAIDLALGGPHAMILGAKAEFGKQIFKAGIKAVKEAMAGGETAAPEAAAAEAAPAAATVAPTAPPIPGYNISQRGTYGFRPDLAPEIPPTAPPPGTWDYSPQTGTYTFRPQAAQPAPAAGLTIDDYAARVLRKSPSELSDADRAAYQNLQNVMAGSKISPTSPRVMSPAEAGQVFPGLGVTPEAPAAPPATAPVPAPQAAPEAPPAPAAAPETPPAPEAPAAPPTRAQQAAQLMTDLESMTRPERMTDVVRRIAANITPEDLKGFSADHWRMIARAAGSPEGTIPTAEDIAQVGANLSQAPAKPPLGGGTVEAEGPAAAAVPEQPPPATLAEALAGKTPAEELPRLEFSQVARDRKVDAMIDTVTRNRIPQSMIDKFGDEEWKLLAEHSGVNPPSETTIAQFKQRLANIESYAQELARTKIATADLAKSGSISPAVLDRLRELRGEPPLPVAEAAKQTFEQAQAAGTKFVDPALIEQAAKIARKPVRRARPQPTSPAAER